MTERVCALPGGLVLANGQYLREAALRPLTGREEDWLAQHADTPNACAVTQLLNACLVRLESQPTSLELTRNLLAGDRDYLMLQLRRLTLGDHFQAVLTCPACAGRLDVDFQTSDIPVTECPQTAVSFTLEPDEQTGATRPLRFRLPNGADQEAVSKLPARQAVQVLLQRCVSDTPLSDVEQKAVSAAMERLAPQVELELDLECPACAETFVESFDTTAFFLTEMRGQGRQLLREIHHLAFYYHWPEAEILSLRRDRRRAYLALLNEALQID